MLLTNLIKQSDLKWRFKMITVLSDLISHALLEFILCCILCQIHYSSFFSITAHSNDSTLHKLVVLTHIVS